MRGWLPFDLTHLASRRQQLTQSIHTYTHATFAGPAAFLVARSPGLHVVSPLQSSLPTLTPHPRQDNTGGGAKTPAFQEKECRHQPSNNHASIRISQLKATVTHKKKEKATRTRYDDSSLGVLDPCRGPPGLGWGVLSQWTACGGGGQWGSGVLGRRRQRRGKFILFSRVGWGSVLLHVLT